MQSKKVYDMVGIGIGPFNLGLAALASEIPGLECLFIDQNEYFNWHPGLLLESARLQVPFYADLVTLANPCSKFSYMAFLKAKQRLFRFAIHEHLFQTRKEYNVYCRWAISQLSNLQFSKRCESIAYNGEDKTYSVQTVNPINGDTELFHAKHIVIGTGTAPYIPECAKSINHPLIFHSSDYLFNKENVLSADNISIVGSGQSAAEIFNDLLPFDKRFKSLSWFTRSARFFPMEYSKLTLEMTSPDYIRYFFRLSPVKKVEALRQQDVLYKGINFSLVNEIYDQLYLKSLDENFSCYTGLFTNCDLQNVSIKKQKIVLDFLHKESDHCFQHSTDVAIMATGYHQRIPDFIRPIGDRIQWSENKNYEVNQNYSIDTDNSVFVQNADLHSHGFNSADLGMGPYRNSIILNAILGYDHFRIEKNIAFQTFGIPKPFNN
jgi:lysine N6-hydroxylase